jgi:2-polyprenyl-3-methyl-5-hydroxy-6-metoxy-1,4-benzoquinol methylase
VADAPSPSAAFSAIYENKTWGKNAEGKGTSGSGSALETTVVYRAFLQQFLKDNGIRSVVDAGCGDWEFSHAIDWTGIDYKGYDIVPAVIEHNKKKYETANVRFFAANIVEADLPPADLVISKHVLQHISNADVAGFLKQLPKFKHALLTNGVDTRTQSAENTDIVAGEYRPLDLLRPPFSLSGTRVLSYYDGMHTHQVIHVTRGK